MKLVVEYTTGEYESICNHVYCVDYESKDLLLIAFNDAFTKWVRYQKKTRVLAKNLSLARASKDPHKISLAEETWKQYCSSEDHFLSAYYLVVDGMKFALPDNNWVEKDGEYEMKIPPDVYTLEEWFELSRPVMVNT